MKKDDLIQKKCKACEGGVDPMISKEIAEYSISVPEWEVSDDTKWIHREFVFQNFVEAMVFVNQVAEVAEGEGHHPDIHIENYKKVRIELSTHAVGGLSK